MKEERKQIVDGYVFTSDILSEKAKKEADGVQYIKQKLNMDDPETVLKLYNRLRMERTFVTPVGFSFLRELQEYLYTIPYIKNEDVGPLDLRDVIENSNKENDERRHKREKEIRKRREQDTKTQRKKILLEQKEENIRSGKIRYKDRFFMSLIINFLLAIAIGAMFYINSTSDSITILNYENKLIDKYESWEKDLEQRETVIKNYEKKYDIQP